MDLIEKYFSNKYLITNILFGAIFSLPLTLGGLLYAMASGETVAENNVIIYIGILFVFDILYLILYAIKKMPKFMCKIFFINDKNKSNTAENLYYDKNYNFKFVNQEIKLKDGERQTLILLTNNIIYKKIIVRLALTLTILTFVIFGIL